ncbi:MAG: U-box domain-containing protein, partial [Promethearchaeia archaeon]
MFPDPVIAADGFTYDRASFAEWLERERKHGRG